MKNIWLIPVIIILGGAAIFLGLRTYNSQQNEAAEQYQRELGQFGSREMGVPILSPLHFSRHGEKAKDDILGVLNSSKSNDLAKDQAMETLLIILGGERSTPILIEQVEKQKSNPVRGRAVALLGEANTQKAAEFLITLADQPGIGPHAVAALSAMPDEARPHQSKLISLLQGKDHALASQAALTLGSIGGPEAQEALLQKMDSGLAQPAARGLARMQNEKGIDYLLQIVSGEQPGDRAAAEAGLTEAGSAAEPKVEALLDSDKPTTIASSLRILQGVGDDKNQKKWSEFLTYSDANVRRSALELLDKRTAPAGGQAAFRLLVDHRNKLTDEEAALAERIARQASATDFAFYETKFESKNSAEQIQAIRIIAFAGDSRAIELLITGLSHDSPVIREESAKSLGRLKGIGGLKEDRERVHTMVSKMAESDPSPQVKKTARSLLIVLRE